MTLNTVYTLRLLLKAKFHYAS